MIKFLRVNQTKVINLTTLFDAEILRVDESEEHVLRLRFIDPLGEPKDGLPALIDPPLYVRGETEELIQQLNIIQPMPEPIATPVPDNKRRQPRRRPAK